MKLDLMFNRASNDFYNKKLYWEKLNLGYYEISLRVLGGLFYIYSAAHDRSAAFVNFINLKKL